MLVVFGIFRNVSSEQQLILAYLKGCFTNEFATVKTASYLALSHSVNTFNCEDPVCHYILKTSVLLSNKFIDL